MKNASNHRSVFYFYCMTSFITQTLSELLSRKIPISQYKFILPSKRAGSYLLNQLSSLSADPVFSPKVLSIEDFAEEVSGLRSIDDISTLFEFYSVYLKHTPKGKVENWETFSSWSQTLLHDFNEIDRYLIDYKPFFSYLSDIQEIDHWSLQKEKTPLMENYLAFWRTLPKYYEKLREEMENKSYAYQGMVYRRAYERIGDYMGKHQNPHVFIGFNALNTAEQEILQEMLNKGIAEIFWDIDEVFFNDKEHDASLFMRNYANRWPFYQKKPFNLVSDNFRKEKSIELLGVPKNVGQAKYVGELLSKLDAEELKDTAVVLGDEGLLLPVLNSLPPNIDEVNVTMGFPLRNAPVTFLFEHLLEMHSRYSGKWYYKDVLTVSNHPLVQKITSGFSKNISAAIQRENLIHLSPDMLLEYFPGTNRKLFDICFADWKNDPDTAISRLQELIFAIRDGLDLEKDKLTLEFLYQHNLLFNKLGNLLQIYPHVTSIKSFFSVYKDFVRTQTVDFKGKPFTGLQVMGVLESRVLDFKNVILTSVNEGVFPAGKSSNSFIPHDLKKEHDLPTYKEKDAIYTYHFYHLMQRASRVFLLYNTESDGLNAGEKSRFLLQMEMEKQELHTIRNLNISPKVPSISKPLQSVDKSPEILRRLKELAGKGFSPSALTTYIRNPLDFYHQYILGIREPEEVEETIAYNTLGTVVHDTLETFYKDWIGTEISVDQLQKAVDNATSEVSAQFKKTYTKDPLSQGQNLLIFEVAKRYVINFLKLEIKEVQAGNKIKVLQVENDLKTEILMENMKFPVFLRGKVDRVDEKNGVMRIIDYKTGKVEQSKVEIVDWNDLTTDYDKYGKTFQILSYASMLYGDQPFTGPTEAGIISFKNLQSGFLKFSKKDKNGQGAKKNPAIDQDVLEAYNEQLKNLISEICSPHIPFLEKEIPQKSW